MSKTPRNLSTLKDFLPPTERHLPLIDATLEKSESVPSEKTISSGEFEEYDTHRVRNG